MRIYIDFDQTINPNGLGPLIKPPYPGAIETIQKLFAAQHKIVIYSCRANVNVIEDQRVCDNLVKEMVEYLAKYEIPFQQIHRGKPDYDIVIDDKAIGFRGNWADVAKDIKDHFE